MDVITWAVSLIYNSLISAFDTAVVAFRAVGLDWAFVVGGLAVLSVILRSFFRVFVGDSMDVSMMTSRDLITSRGKAQDAHRISRVSTPRRLSAGNPKYMLGDGSGFYYNKHKSGRRFTWK